MSAGAVASWSAAAVAGWAAAGVAGLLALIAWRRLASRMELIARGCHELRGPLTAARLGLELGVRVGELSPARLRAIDLELGRAALVLEDLGAGGSRNGGPGCSERVDVEQLLIDSVEAWRASAAAHGVALEVEWRGGPAFVGGDRRRLAQATGNLIANAVEHGGGEVTVRGRLERRGGDGTPRGPLERRREDGTLNGRVAHDTVRVEVIDRGSGLPAPVTELARRPRAGRGSRGRGLAIAAAVAAAHGGRLASAPAERGARLVLELPASQGAPARAPAAG